VLFDDQSQTTLGLIAATLETGETVKTEVGDRFLLAFRQQINKYGCPARAHLVLSLARGMVLGGEKRGWSLSNPLNIPT